MEHYVLEIVNTCQLHMSECWFKFIWQLRALTKGNNNK